VPIVESDCQECGECVKICPVGALLFKDSDTKSSRSGELDLLN
jgi:ferredoxin